MAHMDEWPSVLAYHISVLFDYPCTKRGVQGLMLRLKKKNKNTPTFKHVTGM